MHARQQQYAARQQRMALTTPASMSASDCETFGLSSMSIDAVARYSTRLQCGHFSSYTLELQKTHDVYTFERTLHTVRS